MVGMLCDKPSLTCGDQRLITRFDSNSSMWKRETIVNEEHGWNTIRRGELDRFEKGRIEFMRSSLGQK